VRLTSVAVIVFVLVTACDGRGASARRAIKRAGGGTARDGCGSSHGRPATHLEAGDGVAHSDCPRVRRAVNRAGHLRQAQRGAVCVDGAQEERALRALELDDGVVDHLRHDHAARRVDPDLRVARVRHADQIDASAIDLRTVHNRRDQSVRTDGVKRVALHTVTAPVLYTSRSSTSAASDALTWMVPARERRSLPEGARFCEARGGNVHSLRAHLECTVLYPGSIWCARCGRCVLARSGAGSTVLICRRGAHELFLCGRLRCSTRGRRRRSTRWGRRRYSASETSLVSPSSVTCEAVLAGWARRGVQACARGSDVCRLSLPHLPRVVGGHEEVAKRRLDEPARDWATVVVEAVASAGPIERDRVFIEHRVPVRCEQKV
jgi:hypothetical protein